MVQGATLSAATGFHWLVGWIYLKSYNKQAYLPPYMKTTSGSKTFKKEKEKRKKKKR